jgi:hypothetical protein
MAEHFRLSIRRFETPADLNKGRRLSENQALLSQGEYNEDW